MSKNYEDLTPSAKRYLGFLTDVWFVGVFGQDHRADYYLSEWHDRIQKQQFEYMDSESRQAMREILWHSLGYGILSGDLVVEIQSLEDWALSDRGEWGVGEIGFLRQASHDVFEFITGLSAEEALKTKTAYFYQQVLKRWPENLMADHPAEALLLSREDYALAMSEGEDHKG